MHKYTLQQRQQQIEEKFAQNMKSFYVLALFQKTNYEEVNISLEDLIKVFTVQYRYFASTCIQKHTHSDTNFLIFFIILSYVFICGFPSPEKII